MMVELAIGSEDALTTAVAKLLGFVREAMFDQDASIIFLLFVWLLLVAITTAFAFWLGRISKDWEGWNYIFYGKSVQETADGWMTFSELSEYAKSKGWMQSGAAVINEAYDLNHGIGDAVAKEYIEIIGRFNPQGDTNLNDIYPHKIKNDHWVDHFIDAQSVLIGLQPSSRAVTRPKVSSLGQEQQEYVDLALNRWQVRKWLATQGHFWKGRGAEEYARMQEGRRAFEEMFKHQGEAHGCRSPEGTEEEKQP